MYDSKNESISIDQQTRKCRTEVLSRPYGMEVNLIPVSGKHPPCIEWKPFQTERVPLEKIKEWMQGKFVGKDGKHFWKPMNLNFTLITVNSDDDDAEALVNERCAETNV